MSSPFLLSFLFANDGSQKIVASIVLLVLFIYSPLMLYRGIQAQCPQVSPTYSSNQRSACTSNKYGAIVVGGFFSFALLSALLYWGYNKYTEHNTDLVILKEASVI